MTRLHAPRKTPTLLSRHEKLAPAICPFLPVVCKPAPEIVESEMQVGAPAIQAIPKSCDEFPHTLVLAVLNYLETRQPRSKTRGSLRTMARIRSGPIDTSPSPSDSAPRHEAENIWRESPLEIALRGRFRFEAPTPYPFPRPIDKAKSEIIPSQKNTTNRSTANFCEHFEAHRDQDHVFRPGPSTNCLCECSRYLQSPLLYRPPFSTNRHTPT